MEKQLKRLPNNKIVFGVCAGIAEYFGWDRTVLRLFFVFLVLVTGIFPMVILYVIAYFIMPVDDNDSTKFIK